MIIYPHLIKNCPVQRVFGLPLLAIKILSGLIEWILNISKKLLGCILAVISLPVIAVVQSISYLIAYKARETLNFIVGGEKLAQEITNHQHSKEQWEITFDASLNTISRTNKEQHTKNLLEEEKSCGVQVGIGENNGVSVTVNKQSPVKYNTIELFKKSPFYRFNFAGVTQKFEKAQEEQNNIQFKK